MGMLTKDDVKQIGEVMDVKFLKLDEKFLKLDEKLLTMEERIVDRIVGDVGEAFEQNFLPMVDEMMNEKLAPIQASMVTKDYLDEKMGALEGKLIAQDRKLESKIDAVVDVLVERQVLEKTDAERLESSRVFPRLQ